MPLTSSAISSANASSRNAKSSPSPGTQRALAVNGSPSRTPGATTQSQTNVTNGTTAARPNTTPRRPPTVPRANATSAAAATKWAMISGATVGLLRLRR